MPNARDLAFERAAKRLHGAPPPFPAPPLTLDERVRVAEAKVRRLELALAQLLTVFRAVADLAGDAGWRIETVETVTVPPLNHQTGTPPMDDPYA